MVYSIRFTGRARKQFLRLDAQTRARIEETAGRLRDWPAPGLDIRPLRGQLQGAYRLRVGRYRVIFVVDDERQVISIAAVGHRGSIY